MVVAVKAEAVQGGADVLVNRDWLKEGARRRPIEKAGGISPCELVAAAGDDGVLVRSLAIPQMAGLFYGKANAFVCQ